MKENCIIPVNLREELIDFSKAYNYFSQNDIEQSISNWIESNDIDALYYYLHPGAEDENMHLTCTKFASMDLNDVITLHQNLRKKAELLKKKDQLFKEISKIRLHL